MHLLGGVGFQQVGAGIGPLGADIQVGIRQAEDPSVVLGDQTDSYSCTAKSALPPKAYRPRRLPA